MKKILLLMLTAILLVGCSAEAEETFTEEFNEKAFEYSKVSLLDEENFYYEEQEIGRWELLSESDNHRLMVKYDDDDELWGYYISGENDYEVSYQNAMVISEILGIDQTKLKQGYEKAIDTQEEIEYEDGEYRVMVYDFLDTLLFNIDIEEKREGLFE